MLDVTYGTNSEGRPLAMTGAVNCDIKTFTPLRAFLPSECKWVFRWLFTEAIPKLLGEENCCLVQLVLTDGDEKMYSAFDEAQKRYYPNAVHGLCLYHLVIQKLEDLKLLNSIDPEVDAMVNT